MEDIEQILLGSSERILKKVKTGKNRDYQLLWVTVNFATTRDLHVREIGLQAFGIFMILRAYMNKNYVAFPSLKRISYEAGCSIGTVEKGIKKLVEKGWLQKAGRVKKDGGKFGSSQYLILERDLIRGSERKGYMTEPIANFDNG